MTPHAGVVSACPVSGQELWERAEGVHRHSVWFSVNVVQFPVPSSIKFLTASLLPHPSPAWEGGTCLCSGAAVGSGSMRICSEEPLSCHGSCMSSSVSCRYSTVFRQDTSQQLTVSGFSSVSWEKGAVGFSSPTENDPPQIGRAHV